MEEGASRKVCGHTLHAFPRFARHGIPRLRRIRRRWRKLRKGPKEALLARLLPPVGIYPRKHTRARRRPPRGLYGPLAFWKAVSGRLRTPSGVRGRAVVESAFGVEGEVAVLVVNAEVAALEGDGSPVCGGCRRGEASRTRVFSSPTAQKTFQRLYYKRLDESALRVIFHGL